MLPTLILAALLCGPAPTASFAPSAPPPNPGTAVPGFFGSDQPPATTPSKSKTKQPPADKKPATPPPAPLSKIEKDGYRISNLLPDPLEDGTLGAAEVRRPNLVSGEATLTPEAVKKARTADKNLRIDRFELPEGTVMLQLDVSMTSKLSLLGRSMRTAELITPALLRSVENELFEPVGFWYEDAHQVIIRYTPDKPIRALSELVDKGAMVSHSRDDQHLYLLFAPGKGVEITRFTIGKKTYHEFDPPLKMEPPKK